MDPLPPFINFYMQSFISLISFVLFSCRYEISVKFLLNEEVALYKSFNIESSMTSEKIKIGLTDVHIIIRLLIVVIQQYIITW